MVQAHRFAHRHDHRPAAGLTGSAGTAGQRDASSHRSTAAPSPLDHLLQGAAAGPDHSQVMHQAHHPAPGTWPSPCSAPASDHSSAPLPAGSTPHRIRSRPSRKRKGRLASGLLRGGCSTAPCDLPPQGPGRRTRSLTRSTIVPGDLAITLQQA